MADGYPPNIAEYMADHPPPPTEVWDCNWPAYQLFTAVLTQWRVGMNGPIGLDYTALKTVMDIHGIEDKKQMLEDINVMEVEAIKVIRGKSNG